MNNPLDGVYIFLIVLGVFVVLTFIVIAIVISSKKSNKRNYRSDDGLDFLTPPQQASRVDYDKREAEQYGKAGETYVSKHLGEFINKNGGFLLNDYCFEDEDGYSSEIDHILMTKGGLFIIETKTNKGTLYGDENGDKWVCIKKEYQEDKFLKNPLIQNKGHITHLRKMLKNKCPKMISMVIFPVADISNVTFSGIYDMYSALKYIEEVTATAKYSSDYIKKTLDELRNIKNIYGITKEQHVQNIKRNHEA